MKKLALTVTLVGLWAIRPVHAAEFFCSSGDVMCLKDAINSANGMPGAHIINLEPGSYILQTIDNGNANGLPVISGSIRIQASADDPPTIIERDPGAQGNFRIFDVSAGGELSLEGVTVQRGGGLGGSLTTIGPAIRNGGVTSLQNSVVIGNIGGNGAITNSGTLNIFRTIVAHNSAAFDAGGINNSLGGTALIEFSTIAHNGADGSGGIVNAGVLVVRNSSIIFNIADGSAMGGGIGNAGYLEIVNSTFAKNVADHIIGPGRGGGAIRNVSGGFVSITNSTIRENQVSHDFGGVGGEGGGILNMAGGIVRLQNTIVAGNTSVTFHAPPLDFVAGPPDCVGTITSVELNRFAVALAV